MCLQVSCLGFVASKTSPRIIKLRYMSAWEYYLLRSVNVSRNPEPSAGRRFRSGRPLELEGGFYTPSLK